MTATPNFFDDFYLMFPICDRKDFDKFSLLRKLQILPSVFPPERLDLFAYTYNKKWRKLHFTVCPFSHDAVVLYFYLTASWILDNYI